MNSHRVEAKTDSVIQARVPTWTWASSTLRSKSTMSVPLRIPITTVNTNRIRAVVSSRRICGRYGCVARSIGSPSRDSYAANASQPRGPQPTPNGIRRGAH